MKQAPLETEEDLQLVKEYMLLPVLLDVLERDIRILGAAGLRMDAIYEQVLRRAQDRIIADVALFRKHLRERGIKVYVQQRTKLSLDARYLCRGYHHNFSMLWSLVKAELDRKLSLYLRIDFKGSKRQESGPS
ncbi:hypothetical protein EBB07_32450 [Paenibacillaceae bacterium]|nr:hypothetical protein EBB07_32450 [Paenibacillaceae bacterium]